ncbi:MAG TPA: MerR family transcriptional regulator [Acidobacteriota bacterium]|nr:MerR family transcriptional regulator [Acidobacteriota bacterium]HNC42661.1 MerR family transcriptional regulator [Acidobacteriota bacterium]HND19148.1 MerR family transcriptional regulator [Acidobacteriota bacterium]HNG94177.1 MerR family transcriptional regulator [Acidobacteriota bacterium]HNH83692.1 MerR family transcriptional regulator [Acidobacteriota bacterium]
MTTDEYFMTLQTAELTEHHFLGTSELADAAAQLVLQVVPAQNRGNVSDLPDERTVRYYLAQSLLSEPLGRKGSASIFGYHHLLELLVIKRLQSQNMRIKQIREQLTGKSTAELEALLEIPGSTAPLTEFEPPDTSATAFLESLLAEKSVDPGATQRQTGTLLASASQPAQSAWTRIELEPGLELHIQTGWQFPAEATARHRLARRIQDALLEAGRRK